MTDWLWQVKEKETFEMTPYLIFVAEWMLLLFTELGDSGRLDVGERVSDKTLYDPSGRKPNINRLTKEEN